MEAWLHLKALWSYSCLITFSFLLYRMMKQTANAVLDAFRPGPTAGAVNPHGAPLTPTHHDELHSTALIKLSQGDCILQHQALKFVSSLFLAEPATLEHLKAEGLWELAYGETFFLWSARAGASHAASGELITKCCPCSGAVLCCQQLDTAAFHVCCAAAQCHRLCGCINFSWFC